MLRQYFWVAVDGYEKRKRDSGWAVTPTTTLPYALHNGAPPLGIITTTPMVVAILNLPY